MCLARETFSLEFSLEADLYVEALSEGVFE